MGGSAGQQRVPTNFYNDYFIPLHSRKEQDGFVSVLEAVDHQIIEINNELIKLKNLKAGLMQDLLTGKKRVPSAWKEAA